MRVDIERQPGPGFFGLNGEGIPIDQVFVEVPKLAATGTETSPARSAFFNSDNAQIRWLMVFAVSGISGPSPRYRCSSGAGRAANLPDGDYILSKASAT